MIYPAWYGINWYVAGLVEQTALIEFGMEEDLIYSSWFDQLVV